MAAAAAPESPARLCLILEMRIGGLSKAKGALCTVNQRRPPIEYSTLDPAQTLAGVNAEMRACIIRVYSSSSSSSSSHLKRGVRLSLGGSLCFRWDNRGILGARWFTSVPPRRRCKTNFVKAVGEPRILWSTLVAICFCSSKQGSFSEFFFFFFREDDWFYRLEYSFGNFRFREEDDGMEFWLVLRLKRVLRGDLGWVGWLWSL